MKVEIDQVEIAELVIAYVQLQGFRSKGHVLFKCDETLHLSACVEVDIKEESSGTKSKNAD